MVQLDLALAYGVQTELALILCIIDCIFAEDRLLDATWNQRVTSVQAMCINGMRRIQKDGMHGSPWSPLQYRDERSVGSLRS